MHGIGGHGASCKRLLLSEAYKIRASGRIEKLRIYTAGLLCLCKKNYDELFQVLIDSTQKIQGCVEKLYIMQTYKRQRQQQLLDGNRHKNHHQPTLSPYCYHSVEDNALLLCSTLLLLLLEKVNPRSQHIDLTLRDSDALSMPRHN